jgi:hypothetical protein
MSKLSFLVFAILLFSNIVPAQQVLVHQFFPIGIKGDVFVDTLINKREILNKAGIRKIIVRQVPPVNHSFYNSKTFTIDQDGNIESIRTYFSNPKTDSAFCLTDSCFYTSNGKLTKSKSFDGIGKMYFQSNAEWLDKNSAKCYTIPQIKNDTLIDYKYYDENGRMRRQTRFRTGQDPETSAYFYNKDGLLDSVRYENSLMPTTVLKRTQQKKNKLVEWEHQNGKTSWTYNSSGQCIKTTYYSKNKVPMVGQPYVFTKQRPEYIQNIEISYYYNSNGTLSKITEKQSSGKKLTVTYSYE